MRAIFGVLGLLVVVAIVGVLAKKQLTAVSAPPPGAGAPEAAQPAAPKQRVEQFKQGLEATIQQAPRAMPEDSK